MAIPLPDARQLSDEVLEALGSVPCAAVNWDSPKPMSPTCSGCRTRRSAAGGRLTPPAAWMPSPAIGPAAPWASGGRSRTSRPAASRTDRRAQPRGAGHRRRGVVPQGGARPDPQRMRDRHAGADRRRIPQAVGLHGQGAAPPRQGPGPRRGRRVAGRTYPAIEGRAAREDAEIHWCDETGAAADEQPREGYAREGAGVGRGAEAPHPDEPGRDDHQRGGGPFPDLQGDDDGGAVRHVPGEIAERDDAEGVPDPGSPAGA